MGKSRAIIISFLLILTLILIIGFISGVFAEELDLKISGVINGYGSDVRLRTHPSSGNGLDFFDLFQPASPSNNSKFYSVINGVNLSIDSWNSTDIPRVLNLTFELPITQTGGINFSWNSINGTNYSGNFTYFADNSSYLNPVATVHIRNVTYYNNSITNKNKLYAQIKIIPSNKVPTIVLTSPADNNVTSDRTPTFTYAGSDVENNSLVYDINITCFGGCSAGNILEEDHSGTSFTPTNDLLYLSDNGYYYTWSVRACESDTLEEYCSNWATSRKINITSIVQISLPTSFSNFGSMNIGDSKNTTNDTISALVVRNDGNSKVNISMNATQLWTSVAYQSSDFFLSKIRAFVGNASWANTSWFQIPPTTGLIPAINNLNYTNGSDSVKVDILLESPTGESPGDKTSTINFQAVLSET